MESAAHGSLHGVGPARVGPRAGKVQAGPPGGRRGAKRAASGALAEGGATLPGDEEVGEPCPGGKQPLEFGDELGLDLLGRHVDPSARGRHRDGEVLAPAQPRDAGLVEDPLHRRVHDGRERHIGDRPVVHGVHVDDRTRIQTAPAVPVGRGVSGDEPGGPFVGYRHDDGGGRDPDAVHDDRRARLDGGDLRRQAHLTAASPDGCLGGGPVQVAQRRGGNADVAGIGPAEQGGSEHLHRRSEGRLVDADVEGRHREQLPQGPPGGVTLPV